MNKLSDTELLELARTTLQEGALALQQSAGRLGQDFVRAVQMILNSEGRTIIMGMGKSGLVGKKLAATLASTGTPSLFVHPAEAMHGDLGMVQPQDVVIIFSYSGETNEVLGLLPSLKHFGNRIIAIVGELKSTLAKHADVVLEASVEREVCPHNLAPTTSTLLAMAMGDALAMALMAARDFKPHDFARFHPGGRLGRRLLLKVKDVMHKKLPTARPEQRLHEVILVMTQGRMGLTLVMDNDRLAGVFTDGDLRRAIMQRPEAIHEPVSHFMTKHPIMIDENASIIEAEDLMRDKKIIALLAYDQPGHVTGIMQLFDS